MLQPQKHAHREVVVELGDFDVLGADAGTLESTSQGFLLVRHVPPVFALQVLGGVGLTHAGDDHGRLPKVSRSLAARDDYAHAAIAYETAIEEVERLDNPARVLMILNGNGLAHDSVGIQASVAPAGDRHLAQLAAGGPIQRHVSAR